MDFESHIQSGKPTLVEFYADWSEPSKLLIPVMQEVKEIAGDRATILRIDIEKDKPYADTYQVITVPTLIIFKRGKIIWRKKGIPTSHEILEKLNLVLL